MVRYLTATSQRVACTAAVVLVGLASVPAARASSLFYISGRGDGHGIGMSQYGAYGYAQHGWTYRHILGHYYQGTGIRTTDPSRILRVLLGIGSAGNPGFAGASSAVAPRAGNRSVALSTDQRYSVHALSGGGLALYDQSGRQLLSVRPPLIVTGPGPIDFSGHGHYRGSLEFRWRSGPHAQTVDAVDLEDYVRGVVAAEMPASWSAQALEAQAVAARTYAITTSVSGNGYSLYSDTRSQMYGGVSAETSATDAAVSATRGQMVTLAGRPVVTYFFASSGGHTESVQDVWLGSQPEPWLRGVDDLYDSAGGNPYYQWSVRMTMSSAAAKLGSIVKGSFRGIGVTQRGTSPRVVDAYVVGSGGRSQVTGPQLQSAFGLISTYMSFSTISTSAAQVPVRTRVRSGHVALEPIGFAAPRPTSLSLGGRVRPVRAGAALAVQELLAGRWQTILSRVRVGRNGAYRARLPWPGRYRVSYRGLYGPAVRVG